MNIYVDALTPCITSARWRFSEACHMYCAPGDLEALHAFAQKIGLKRAWFQNHPRLPHYDLNDTRRAVAVGKGAIETDREHVGAMMRAWKEHVVAQRSAAGRIDLKPVTTFGEYAHPEDHDKVRIVGQVSFLESRSMARNAPPSVRKETIEEIHAALLVRIGALPETGADSNIR